jgi:2,3-bisphosphoglycerate-independent phosphoglycerate mutase
MKYAIILPDGAADEPLPQLGDRTPLEAASIPHMSSVAERGVQGLVQTVPEGYVSGTDVATLCLFGYDPRRYYSGRAPIEAAAKGLTATADQLIFRCNLVTLEDGRMKDFTAGHITQPDADELIAALNADPTLRDQTCTFHAGVSYRNLMFLGDAAGMQLTCAPPHDIPDQAVADHWPKGGGAERVMAVMERAAAVIADHPVNRRRREAGKSPATNIWLWGQGRPVPLPTFAERFGLRGAVITGVDIIRGLAKLMGMKLIEVPGATGYIDTNFVGKGAAAVQALDDHDLVVVHVEAADEAGHLGDAAEKVKALERIDAEIVGPVMRRLEREKEWRVLVAPDHPTPVGTRAHSPVPPPFCYAGSDVTEASKRAFSEFNGAAIGPYLEHGIELIQRFIVK